MLIYRTIPNNITYVTFKVFKALEYNILDPSLNICVIYTIKHNRYKG